MRVQSVLFNIYCVIKSMKTRWAGHVALMLQEGTGRNLWSKDMNRRNQVDVTCTDGRIIFKRLAQ